jgi:peptide/nickel transport system ATP-binding protein
MTALITVTNVSKRFRPNLTLGEKIAAKLGSPVETRTVHAVDNVSLVIRKGEVLGLVGESGCGKSTLGRVIAGIHPPSEGAALLDGQLVMGGGRRPVKTTTKIQMVFQDPFASLDPRVRVGDTIAEGPLAHGLTTRSEAIGYVRSWLARVGLPADATGRFPHQFSGGQRQRIAIARALAMQPDVLVCDEPVASLDVSIQAQIVNLFLQLRRELGLTMLFISHDLGVVRHISDRIAVMYLGRIVETGPTAEVYAAPRHPYTRALLDSVPKLVTGADELVSFKPIAGELPSPLSPPPGCHFHLRCPYATDRCKAEVPVLGGKDVRTIACHHPL